MSPSSSHDHLFRIQWNAAQRELDLRGPVLAPEVVAVFTRRVMVVDVRTEAQRHIPGSRLVPAPQLDAWSESLDKDIPIVLVDGDGTASPGLAMALRERGHSMVAGLDGGIRRWRRLGFLTRPGPPAEKPVESAAFSGEMGVEAIQAHIGNAPNIRWIPMAALQLHGLQSCVDGRDEQGVVGTPGGDAGEFVLALAAYESASGNQLSPEQVAHLLNQRLESFGRFYLHTDLHALDVLTEALRADSVIGPKVAPIDGAADWSQFLKSPPSELQDRLVGIFQEANHVGCGHLKLILNNSESYAVRQGLAKSVIAAFFRAHWADHPDVQFTPLAGAHTEAAVVNICLPRGCNPYSHVPCIAPQIAGSSLFVNHPEVTVRLRQSLSQFVAEKLDSDASRLAAVQAELGDQQMGLTLGALAAGLPIFNVAFDDNHDYRVEAVGAVPT